MALVKTTLSAQIKLLLDELSTKTDNPEQSRQDLADGIADAVDTYIKLAQVVGTSPSGAVTGVLQ